MKACIYWPGKVAPWLPPWLKAVAKGFERHSVEYVNSRYVDLVDCDLAVHWSIRPQHIITRQRAEGKDNLILELGYVGNRRKWTSMGYNGLNNRADFCVENASPGRWERHWSDRLQPWSKDGEYILLVGQVEGDMSVQKLNMQQWYEDQARLARELYDVPVLFRQHPEERRKMGERKVPGCNYSTGNLASDLAGCLFAVTYNSNVGVDAILAGKRVVATDEGAMVWPLAAHSLKGFVGAPEREQWCYDLAWKQWRLEEIASGDAWEHLKRKYS